MCEGAILWKASLQSIVALSTTKAKYVAATEGVKEATWLRGLVTKLGVSQGTTVAFLDSQSTIHLTKNDAYHSKTKHISVKLHYARDTVAARNVVRKVRTSKNPTDMLTNSLPIAKSKHCLDLVGVHSIWLPFGALPLGAHPSWCSGGVRELVSQIGPSWRLVGYGPILPQRPNEEATTVKHGG